MPTKQIVDNRLKDQNVNSHSSIQSYIIIEEISNKHTEVQYLCRRESSFRKREGKQDPHFLLTKYPKNISVHELVSTRIEALLFLQEKELIRVHECFFTENEEFCVVEKLESGIISLRQYLFERRSTENLIQQFSEILQALRILHAIDQVYGTLNCSNILVDTNLSIPKLILRPFFMDLPLLKLFPLKPNLKMSMNIDSKKDVTNATQIKYLDATNIYTSKNKIPEILRKKRTLTYTTLEKIEDPYSFTLNPEGKLSIMQFQENWIWYEAPENVFLMTKHRITPEIDIWALGCIMMELYLSHPIFSANSIEDQIVNTIHVLGYPQKDEIEGLNQLGFFDYVADSNSEKMEFKTSQQVKQTIYQLIQRSPAISVQKYEKEIDSILDLIVKLLIFHPKKRLSISEIIENPIFNIDNQELFSIIHRSNPKTSIPLVRKPSKPNESITKLNNTIEIENQTPQLTKNAIQKTVNEIPTEKKEIPTIKKNVSTIKIDKSKVKKNIETLKSEFRLSLEQVPQKNVIHKNEFQTDSKLDKLNSQLLEVESNNDTLIIESLQEKYERMRNEKKQSNQEKIELINNVQKDDFSTLSTTTENLFPQEINKKEVKEKLKEALLLKKTHENQLNKISTPSTQKKVRSTPKKKIEKDQPETPLRKVNRKKAKISIENNENIEQPQIIEIKNETKQISTNDNFNSTSSKLDTESNIQQISKIIYPPNTISSPQISTPGSVSFHFNSKNQLLNPQIVENLVSNENVMDWMTDEDSISPDSPLKVNEEQPQQNSIPKISNIKQSKIVKENDSIPLRTNSPQIKEKIEKRIKEKETNIQKDKKISHLSPTQSQDGPVSTLTRSSESIEESLVLVSLLNDCNFDLKVLTKRLLNQTQGTTSLLQSPEVKRMKPSLELVSSRQKKAKIKQNNDESYTNESQSEEPLSESISTPFTNESVSESNNDTSLYSSSESETDIKNSLKKVKSQLKYLRKSNHFHAKLLKKVSQSISPNIYEVNSNDGSIRKERKSKKESKALRYDKVLFDENHKKEKNIKDLKHKHALKEIKSRSNKKIDNSIISTYESSSVDSNVDFKVDNLNENQLQYTHKDSYHYIEEDKHKNHLKSKHNQFEKSIHEDSYHVVTQQNLSHNPSQNSIQKVTQNASNYNLEEKYLQIIIDSMKGVPSKARYYLYSWVDDLRKVEIPVKRRFKEREIDGRRKFVEEKFCVRIRGIPSKEDPIWNRPLNIDLFQSAEDLKTRSNCLATCTIDLYLISLCLEQDIYEINGWYHVLTSMNGNEKIFGQMQIRTSLLSDYLSTRSTPSKLTAYESTLSSFLTHSLSMNEKIDVTDMYQTRNGSFAVLQNNTTQSSTSIFEHSLEGKSINRSNKSSQFKDISTSNTNTQDEVQAILSETQQLFPKKIEDQSSVNFEDVLKLLINVEESLIGKKSISQGNDISLGYESNGETKYLESTLAQLKKLNSSMGVSSSE